MLNILAFIIFPIFSNAGSSNLPYSHSIHYPVEQQFSRDCQLENSELPGICKRFSECESAQKGWFGARIYPTICYYDRFEAIVCCGDEGPTHLNLQNQPARSNQASIEYKPTPRISQERCEAVYNKISLIVNEPIEINQYPIYQFPSLVGGEPTDIGQYPFMAAIGWRRFDNKLDFNCGGFLVSKRFVLTAAHCATLGGDKPVAVRTGGINLDNMTSSDLDIPIEEIIVHPNYNDKQTYNDIALMRLSKNANDQFGCLWQKNEIDKVYDEVKAIGYGHKQFGGPGSNTLLQIKLKLFDNKQCSQYYKPEYRFPNGIIDSQICSGDLTRAKDTCQGDSGGPIFIERTSNVGTLTPVVIGITSFGQGCAGEAPSIYTRISAYLDWIEPIVWPI